MKHVKIPILKFNELNEKARQFALSAQGDINTDHNWWEDTYRDANDIELKISEFELEGSRYWAKGSFLNIPATVAALIVRNHGESTETYLLAKQYQLNAGLLCSKYKDADTKQSDLIDQEIEVLDESFLNDLLRQYAKMLKEDYDYRTSEAAIIETIEANDYDFMADGEMWGTFYAASIQAEEVN